MDVETTVEGAMVAVQKWKSRQIFSQNVLNGQITPYVQRVRACDWTRSWLLAVPLIKSKSEGR